MTGFLVSSQSRIEPKTTEKKPSGREYRKEEKRSEREEMARNSGVLIRQLLGNRNNPCAAGRLHHLHQKPIQNLTSVPNTTPSSPHTIDIRSASKPFSNYSIHTPNLQYLQQRRFLSSSSLSESDSDSKHLLSGPSNLFVIQCVAVHTEAVNNVKDARLSAVFYYTAPGCRATRKWITPILDELCEQFQHIKMYKVYMDKNGPKCPLAFFRDPHGRKIAGSRLDKLGIYKTPMLHCYLKGERVDEVSGASIKHLKKRLENVYNPSGMKKRKRQGKKDENNGGFVAVLPSLVPETSFPVMAELGQVIFDFDDEEEMTDDADKMPFDEEKRARDKMWWFAKGLFSSKKKREMFCKLKDPEAKRKWIKSEMAKE
ncbi:uncharacterized protein LOC110766673 isoform X2 [Prunus avium]|uniref:Uncharacterized protein LOC110766673 isoform X2 n=1 Tax=Prunus avium TaxID=42229 RepID=A0A6P5TEH0_PRUAV|nr:uncharacterized protein LOC110766673 isoform X2 [Prunus avium]